MLLVEVEDKENSGIMRKNLENYAHRFWGLGLCAQI